MDDISSMELMLYRQERLPPARMAEIERFLKSNAAFAQRYQTFCEELNDVEGVHSVGAIWKRYRLTCLDRPSLLSFVRGILLPEESSYITFHLETIGCPICQANLDDLRLQETGKEAQKRRKKIADSSLRFLSE